MGLMIVECGMGKQRTDKREQTTDTGKWGKENRNQWTVELDSGKKGEEVGR